MSGGAAAAASSLPAAAAVPDGPVAAPAAPRDGPPSTVATRNAPVTARAPALPCRQRHTVPFRTAAPTPRGSTRDWPAAPAAPPPPHRRPGRGGASVCGGESARQTAAACPPAGRPPPWRSGRSLALAALHAVKFCGWPGALQLAGISRPAAESSVGRSSRPIRDDARLSDVNGRNVAPLVTGKWRKMRRLARRGRRRCREISSGRREAGVSTCRGADLIHDGL